MGDFVMIIQTVNFSMFHDAFRTTRPDHFNYDGQKALYDYLDELEDPYDLDVIELCGDYQQMTLEEAREQYDIPDYKDAAEWLTDKTTVIPVADGSFIVGTF
jgi:hypothetical protein